MRDHCHEVLDAAYAAGIRYFDAARSYGLAESFLSEWLRARGLQPSQVAVGSKWGYAYTADWRIDTGERVAFASERRSLGVVSTVANDALLCLQVGSRTR